MAFNHACKRIALFVLILGASTASGQPVWKNEPPPGWTNGPFQWRWTSITVTEIPSGTPIPSPDSLGTYSPDDQGVHTTSLRNGNGTVAGPNWQADGSLQIALPGLVDPDVSNNPGPVNVTVTHDSGYTIQVTASGLQFRDDAGGENDPPPGGGPDPPDQPDEPDDTPPEPPDGETGPQPPDELPPLTGIDCVDEALQELQATELIDVIRSLQPVGDVNHELNVDFDLPGIGVSSHGLSTLNDQFGLGDLRKWVRFALLVTLSVLAVNRVFKIIGNH